MGCLLPASALANEPGQHGQKRSIARTVVAAGRPVSLRDQATLHAGNVALQGGWTFERLVEELNARVFFWPGRDAPIDYGRRHFERYRSEGPALLRLDFLDICVANPRVGPDVCRYNSGSPRFSNGRPSPRGPDTFQPLALSDLTPSQVVEVTFRRTITLPPSVEVAAHPEGPWAPLFVDTSTP